MMSIPKFSGVKSMEERFITEAQKQSVIDENFCQQILVGHFICPLSKESGGCG